jgi:hypothetical protein
VALRHGSSRSVVWPLLTVIIIIIIDISHIRNAESELCTEIMMFELLTFVGWKLCYFTGVINDFICRLCFKSRLMYISVFILGTLNVGKGNVRETEQAETLLSKLNRRVLSSLSSESICLCLNNGGTILGGAVCQILFASSGMLSPGHSEMASRYPR